MGKIVISTNATLDGFVQDPDGEEGTRRGGWWKQFVGNDFEAWAKLMTEEASRARALLLGRRSDAWFGSRSPKRTGEYFERINSLPKYIVSSTLQTPIWNNATVLKSDVVAEVSKLKQKVDGDILVYGSFRLWHTLLERDLVDEVRVFLFPVVLGEGERLFGGTSDKKPLRMVGARTVGEGLVHLTYQRVRGA